MDEQNNFREWSKANAVMQWSMKERGVGNSFRLKGERSPFWGQIVWTGIWIEGRSKICRDPGEKSLRQREPQVQGPCAKVESFWGWAKRARGKGKTCQGGEQGLDRTGQWRAWLREQVGSFLFSKCCQVGSSSENMMLSQRNTSLATASLALGGTEAAF